MIMLSSDSQNLISLRVNRSICYHSTSGVSPNSTLKTYVAGANGTIPPLLPWQLRYRSVLHYVSSGGKGRRPANQSCALETLTWLGLNFPLESTCAALRPAADHKYSSPPAWGPKPFYLSFFVLWNSPSEHLWVFLGHHQRAGVFKNKSRASWLAPSDWWHL